MIRANADMCIWVQVATLEGASCRSIHDFMAPHLDLIVLLAFLARWL
jgi:hypothetical protein